MDFTSSTGSGLSMRIKSFAALLIPVLNEILKGYGVNIIPDDFTAFVDAAGVIIFTVLHVYGWARRNFMKKTLQGKFAYPKH